MKAFLAVLLVLLIVPGGFLLSFSMRALGALRDVSRPSTLPSAVIPGVGPPTRLERRLLGVSFLVTVSGSGAAEYGVGRFIGEGIPASVVMGIAGAGLATAVIAVLVRYMGVMKRAG